MGKDGKSTGKLIGSIAVGLITGSTAFFTKGMAWSSWQWSSALMGASLFSSIWTATHQNNRSQATVVRFDKEQEQMSSDGRIQVVYGRRRITGNQTYHKTNADANQLYKHVVLCEGGIEGIESVCANELMIPTGTQTKDTVFTIMNTKYSDAFVEKRSHTLKLTCNGTTKEIFLCDAGNLNSDNTYYDWQVSIASLISYINRLNDGWQAFPVASTTKYPADIKDNGGACYNTQLNLEMDTVTGGTKYTFKDCEAPSNYEEVGGYPNLAWLDMYFSVSSELNGNPTVTCLVKGKKVYDIRTGETAYSTNPAMCLRDFLLSKRYGLGRWFSASDLDDDTWAEAADYCDEEITFLDGSGAEVTAKRYELNMVIDEKRSALDWLQEMLANFSGYIVYSNGLLKLKIERETPVSYRFTDDTCFDLKIEPLALSETPNHYAVTIIDPLNNWKSVKCLVDDYADQRQRQKITTKEVSLEGVTSQNQALRLARFYRDYNLVCPLQVSFSTGMQAMHLEPGDVVTISYHEVFKELPIRISEIKETNKGTFEISGRQYNETIYGDILSGGIHWYNYTVASTDDSDTVIPDNIQGITANSKYREYSDGSTGYDISVKYILPQGAETVLVYYKTDAVPAEDAEYLDEDTPADEVGFEQEWIYAGDSPSGLIIHNAQLGDTYKIRAVARSSTGNLSRYTDTIELRVTPKATVPSQPYGFTYDFSDTFRFSWNDIEDSDVLYYELRLNTDIGSEDGLLGRTRSSMLDVVSLPRKGTAYLYSVNSLQAPSYPSEVSWNVRRPMAPVLEFSELVRGVKISTELATGVRTVRLYITGQNYSNVIEMYNNTYEFYADADIYTIQAVACDMFGEGYRSVDYFATVKPVFNGEWIEDGSIIAAKFDAAIRDSIDDIATNLKNIEDLQEIVEGLDGDIVAANGRIDEANAALGEISTSLGTINGDIAEIKSNAESLTSTFGKYRTDNDLAVSQVKQTADTVSTAVLTKDGLSDKVSAVTQKAGSIEAMLGSDPDASGQYKAITSLKATADGLSSAISAANGNISSVTQTANDIIATLGKDADASGQYKAISQVKAQADSISTAVSDVNGLVSAVTQKAGSIEAMLQSAPDAQGQYKAITDIKATADGLTSLVSGESGLTSQIKQTNDSISTIITNMSSLDTAKQNYTAFTQMDNAIGLRVQKGDVINQINLTEKGTTIDGKYLHVTGDTQFDNNVIVGNMLSAGAITADKISSGAVTGDKIASTTITGDKIATGTITASNIAAGAITADKIAAGEITADKLAAGSISADYIEVGSIKKKTLSGKVVDVLQENMEGTKDTSKWRGVYVGRYNNPDNTYTVYSEYTIPEDGELIVSDVDTWTSGSSDDADRYYAWSIVKINGIEQVDVSYGVKVNPTNARGIEVSRTESYPDHNTLNVKKGDIITTTHFVYEENGVESKREQDFSANNRFMNHSLEAVFKPYDWNDEE